MNFLDVIAGPIYGAIALIFAVPILVVVLITVLIIRWKKKKDNDDSNKDS